MKPLNFVCLISIDYTLPLNPTVEADALCVLRSVGVNTLLFRTGYLRDAYGCSQESLC